MSKTIKINTTPCPDGTVTLNGESFVTVPSGGTVNKNIFDLDGNTLTVVEVTEDNLIINTGNGFEFLSGDLFGLTEGGYLTTLDT